MWEEEKRPIEPNSDFCENKNLRYEVSFDDDAAYGKIHPARRTGFDSPVLKMQKRPSEERRF